MCSVVQTAVVHVRCNFFFFFCVYVWQGKKIKVGVVDSLQCQAIFSVCFQLVGVTVDNLE